MAGRPSWRREETIVISIFGAQPRKVLALICAACVAMLAFGLYLQHVVGLNPCPMCIVQRYALIVLAVFALIGAFMQGAGGRKAFATLAFLAAGFGAFVAARQSFLQWYPPEFASCGRDFYGMIETFPLQRAIPMIFKGSGDCTAIDWTFLGGSIANWSFLAFVVLGLLLLGVMAARTYRPRRVGDR
jgi:disulfide bond formation protein DsbB